VLENPTCRWSTIECKNSGVDPFAPDCVTQAATAGPDFADCCLNEANDEFLSPLVQERAWTSPIWYKPTGVERMHGKLHFGGGRLDLRLRFDAAVSIDPDTQPLDITLRDDADIYLLNVPPGTLEQRRPGRYVYKGGALPGVRKLKLAQRPGKAANLKAKVDGLDLSGVDRDDHLLELLVRHGDYCPAVGRTWVSRGDNLRTRFGRP
jgi:hypothetical protein